MNTFTEFKFALALLFTSGLLLGAILAWFVRGWLIWREDRRAVQTRKPEGHLFSNDRALTGGRAFADSLNDTSHAALLQKRRAEPVRGEIVTRQSPNRPRNEIIKAIHQGAEWEFIIRAGCATEQIHKGRRDIRPVKMLHKGYAIRLVSAVSTTGASAMARPEVNDRHA